jgi:hypothetical protein
MQKKISLLRLFVLIFFAASSALADSFFIGHNLAPSTDLPTKRTWTVGSYLIAYAATDSCLIGTNAWMAWNYNSYSAIARCRIFGETPWFSDSSLQLAYIQSDKSLGDDYRQTLGIVWWTIKNTFNDTYTLYTTLNFMHFWDETIPFSLRRDPGNDQPFQFTLSTLHRIKWNEQIGFALEFGVLGLNYRTPLVHNGYSIYKMGEHSLLQAGLSVSGIPNNASRLYSHHEPQSIGSGYDYTIHPEVQLQYFF